MKNKKSYLEIIFYLSLAFAFISLIFFFTIYPYYNVFTIGKNRIEDINRIVADVTQKGQKSDKISTSFFNINEFYLNEDGKLYLEIAGKPNSRIIIYKNYEVWVDGFFNESGYFYLSCDLMKKINNFVAKSEKYYSLESLLNENENNNFCITVENKKTLDRFIEGRENTEDQDLYYFLNIEKEKLIFEFSIFHDEISFKLPHKLLLIKYKKPNQDISEIKGFSFIFGEGVNIYDDFENDKNNLSQLNNEIKIISADYDKSGSVLFKGIGDGSFVSLEKENSNIIIEAIKNKKWQIFTTFPSGDQKLNFSIYDQDNNIINNLDFNFKRLSLDCNKTNKYYIDYVIREKIGVYLVNCMSDMEQYSVIYF